MKRKREVKIASCPDDVVPEAWETWLAIRDQKRFSALTEYALHLMKIECAKAGMTLQQAIDYCISKEWAGFRAEYVKNQPKTWAEKVEKQARELGITASPHDTHQSLQAKISASDQLASRLAARDALERFRGRAH